jgi:hypothetical protein
MKATPLGTCRPGLGQLAQAVGFLISTMRPTDFSAFMFLFRMIIEFGDEFRVFLLNV